jgi:outer membrane protein assembly factor BamA
MVVPSRVQGPKISSLLMNSLEKTFRISSCVGLLIGFLLQGSLLAQQDHTIERDSIPSSRSGIYPLPFAFYTPETGIAGGVAALYLYRDSSSPRASSLTADVIYTQQKQFVTEIAGDQYFENGQYRLLTDLLFQKYPNKFFGVGNNTPESSEETYTPQTFLLKAVLYRNLYPHVNIGPVVRYENTSMRETAAGGILATGILPGSGGGSSAGIGIAANWDSRDNTFATQSGSFYQLTALFYRSAFGSDYRYDDIQIETRNFFTPLFDHVIAVQGSGEFIDGSAPFYSYAKFGGQNLLRGYFDGRYRDKNAVSLQAEYRVPVWWRFGIVGFAGIAQVADQIRGLAMDRFWLAGGIGLRFAWNPEERINLRLDYGAGKNSSGMYITITEAF